MSPESTPDAGNEREGLSFVLAAVGLYFGYKTIAHGELPPDTETVMDASAAVASNAISLLCHFRR